MDSDLLDELYAQLERDPQNVAIHEMLLEIWIAKDEGTAAAMAGELLELHPQSELASNFLEQRITRGAKGKEPERVLQRAASPAPRPRPLSFNLSDDSEDELSEHIVIERYCKLKEEAGQLLLEVGKLANLGPPVFEDEETILKLHALSEGRVGDVVSLPSIRPVREVARDIGRAPDKCLEMIVKDFEEVYQWATTKPQPMNKEEVRSKLVSRRALLDAALPDAMHQQPTIALSHIEHRYLDRSFENTETMYGDPIEAIPREHFFVSEDNYAWDMTELVQALGVNDGVMRNPLNKQMFSERDIVAILAHPLGQSLRPLQLAQDQLKKGIRSETISWVKKLGALMLDDNSTDAGPSLQAVDEFLVYLATLPEAEQRTVNSLKIPATDKMSYAAYDYTIGDSVREAKAGTTCFHKVGDFLSQAATHLENS